MFSDKVIAHGLHRTILSRLKYQYASTYLLRFDFDSPYSFAKRLFVGRSGSVAGNKFPMIKKHNYDFQVHQNCNTFDCRSLSW